MLLVLSCKSTVNLSKNNFKPILRESELLV